MGGLLTSLRERGAFGHGGKPDPLMGVRWPITGLGPPPPPLSRVVAERDPRAGPPPLASLWLIRQWGPADTSPADPSWWGLTAAAPGMSAAGRADASETAPNEHGLSAFWPHHAVSRLDGRRLAWRRATGSTCGF